jgi:hypothetical protein
MKWLWETKISSPLQLAVDELEETQRMRLHHSNRREYHAAMEQMLYERIDRLRVDIMSLSEGETKEKAPESLNILSSGDAIQSHL